MKYAVVDLEMCRVLKQFRTEKFPRSREIIQIGAVLLDESYEIIDQFSSYVSPEYGCLNREITKLTGITEKDLDGAPQLEEALKKFLRWLPEDVQMVEWSTAEECQFSYEIQGKQIMAAGMEVLQRKWRDCQEMFDHKVASNRSYNLTEALNLSDIMYRDGAHDARTDAYNTALLFAKLCRTPDYKLNQYYLQMGTDEQRTLSCSIGNMLPWVNSLTVA